MDKPSYAEHRLPELAARMREEWDRRVAHDYRYWMSDGVRDDAEMWRTGFRDFQVLSAGLDTGRLKEQTALEIGCGVGRLLRPAAEMFGRVIGLDVSREAVEKGVKFLSDLRNVEVVLGNGLDLSPVASASVDFAFTFAAMSSMPIAVIASYLSELGRVVKRGGVLRLQLYLGTNQTTYAEDTLAVRCFERDSFFKCVGEAGFTVEFAEELRLPFEVSNYREGVIATIVGLKRNDRAPALPDALAPLLVPQGEKLRGESWSGSQTEYLMAVARAKQHMEAGEVPEAIAALEFAVGVYKEAEQEVLRILEDLRLLKKEQTGSAAETRPPAAQTSASERPSCSESMVINPWPANIEVLRRLFPAAAAEVDKALVPDCLKVDWSSNGKKFMRYKGFPLSNQEKPERAGQIWAERLVADLRLANDKKILLAGFGDGYHLQALLSSCANPVIVFEPRPEILKAALETFDLTHTLRRLSGLIVSLRQLQNFLDREDSSHIELIMHPLAQAVSGEMLATARRLFRAGQGLEKIHPSFAVVGPMYGGSLPIASYVYRALLGLRQRVHSYDLSKFYKSFVSVGDFLRDPMRKGSVESQYVELLSQLVLEGINERPIDILLCLAQAPLSPRVLKEIRERGIITVMWFVEDCGRFQTWKQIAPYYDYMFLIQRGDYLKQVEQAGAARAIYLPVGCDPEVHRPLDLSDEEKSRFGSQLSFVGAGYNNRRHVFSMLADYNFKIWGTEWPACLPFTKLLQDGGARIDVADYVKIFNASEINLNLHSSQERDGVEPFGDFVNPRTFELAAAGAFQLVDNRQLLEENFEIGREAAVFHDEKELQEQITHYLAHPEERKQISLAARSRALAEHTYQHRLRTMLEYIYADRFEELAARVKQSPWQKTFEAAKPYTELSNRFKSVYDRGQEPMLDSLVQDIQTGRGSLTETEQTLLFLHHIRSQISYIRKLRNE